MKVRRPGKARQIFGAALMAATATALLAPLVVLLTTLPWAVLSQPIPTAPPRPIVVDVRDFGAQGSGVADDRAAIQRAIDRAKTLGLAARSGATVYLPPGDWGIGGPLVLPRTGLTPDNVVRLSGALGYTSTLHGLAGFPSNRGMIEWEATTARAWHQRIENLSFELPNVLGVRAIWHKANAAQTTLAAVMDEWLQLDLENLYVGGSNQYHDVLIDLEVGDRFATIRNVVGDPVRGSAINYNTLLLRTPSQYSGADPAPGEDSVGLGFCTVDNVHSMIRRGGYCRLFQGRAYGTSWRDSFNNGMYAGTNAYGFDFRNCFSLTLDNLQSEGAGGVRQFSFYKCREISARNLTVPPGAPSGEVAWQASHAYLQGDRVVPTRLKIPSAPAPRNLVYTCTTPGTTGGSEPAWSAAGGTTTDNTVVWTASTYQACADGVVLESCEGVTLDTHFASGGETPPSYRLTKSATIDANCRGVKLINWAVRGIVSGGAYTANTDAANEISIAAAADNNCHASGELLQSFNDWRIAYKLGQDPRTPTTTATLDFASMATSNSASLTVSLTGASTGEAVLATPPANLSSALQRMAYVSAPNTITITLFNPTASTIDPPSGTWRVTVMK